jgi:copper homeostasis protein CutC
LFPQLFGHFRNSIPSTSMIRPRHSGEFGYLQQAASGQKRSVKICKG